MSGLLRPVAAEATSGNGSRTLQRLCARGVRQTYGLLAVATRTRTIIMQRLVMVRRATGHTYNSSDTRVNVGYVGLGW